jgi:hypothetical protein
VERLAKEKTMKTFGAADREKLIRSLQQRKREYQELQEQERRTDRERFLQHENERVIRGIEVKQEAKENKYTQPIYSPKDVDSLISMLTLWIDDRKLIQNMEEMYKHWKATQKI